VLKNRYIDKCTCHPADLTGIAEDPSDMGVFCRGNKVADIVADASRPGEHTFNV
jgi:hypothetical protein